MTARDALRHIVGKHEPDGVAYERDFSRPGSERRAQRCSISSRANRHGLIAGATGTGKTVTLQGLAESFSADGVPVFVADVKGDLSGIRCPARRPSSTPTSWRSARRNWAWTDYAYSDNPAIFWDLYGEQGHPIRTTISEMGPLLLARLLDLNETQEGVLKIVFRYADEQGPAAARSRATCRRCWPMRRRTPAS